MVWAHSLHANDEVATTSIAFVVNVLQRKVLPMAPNGKD